MEPVLDALGQPIVLGNFYGYSRNESGWSHVIIGRAFKTTDNGKVHLIDCTMKKWLYGKETVPSESINVTIRAFMVFPIFKAE